MNRPVIFFVSLVVILQMLTVAISAYSVFRTRKQDQALLLIADMISDVGDSCENAASSAYEAVEAAQAAESSASECYED